ncbi:MAG: ComF family protein [Candidatus Omnitrophota bacterium]|jgi:ComF family protein|nr:MAG: ComF family protein [Candidatus Omnitrophota bacterium]
MFARLGKGLKDILYPPTCIACRKRLPEDNADAPVCRQCYSAIKKNLPPFCYRCGRQLDIRRSVKNLCAECIRKTLHFDRALSPCKYEGVMKELIHAFKYRGKDYLGKDLGELMVDFIKEYGFDMKPIDLIMPIPLYRSKIREREFNQAQVLGDFVAKAFNKESICDGLIRHRQTRPQAELQGQARMQNIKGCFSLTSADLVKERNILLIDDVLTTGATASEAAAVLKKAGAHTIFVMTLAN